jgi:hypothetical protein
MRGAAFAGLAAASASLAHGDARDVRWLATALCGAALATMVLGVAASTALRRLPPHTAAPLGLIVAAMLAAQAAAHAGLLAAGVFFSVGAAGGIALHLFLAVLSALLVRGIDLRIESATAPHGRSPDLQPAADRGRLTLLEPRAARLRGACRGRAPPKPA